MFSLRLVLSRHAPTRVLPTPLASRVSLSPCGGVRSYSPVGTPLYHCCHSPCALADASTLWVPMVSPGVGCFISFASSAGATSAAHPRPVPLRVYLLLFGAALRGRSLLARSRPSLGPCGTRGVFPRGATVAIGCPLLCYPSSALVPRPASFCVTLALDLA